MVEYLRVDPYRAAEDCDSTNGAHVRFSYLKKLYGEHLYQAALAKKTAQAAGEPVEDDIFVQFHHSCAIWYFLMYLVGTSVFVDTSGHYTDVAYLRHFTDLSTIRDWNSGATVLTYLYQKLNEASRWRVRALTGSCTLLTVHFYFNDKF